jgi:restriction endonuclease-like protein
MKEKSPPAISINTRATASLREALVRRRPDIEVDTNGYVQSFRDNLVPLISTADFEADLSAGNGNELETKFRAAHSSSALAVNCFSPFRSRIADLTLPLVGNFSDLQFERKCPTGLKRGIPPNLDVMLSGVEGVIGVESKLTEHLGRHRAKFSPAYAEEIRDQRREEGYFREMIRLIDEPRSYNWLDAAQLIKHAFGLAKTFSGRPVTLLYLFWEPENPQKHPVFEAHRREVAEFSDRVTGSTPNFVAMSYPELWSFWRREPLGWLSDHLDELAGRYSIVI